MQVSRSLSVLVFAQASVMAGCASDNSSKTAPKAAAAAGQGGSSGTGGSATGGSATGGSSADGGTSGSGGASGSGGTKGGSGGKGGSSAGSGGTGGTMGGSGGMASGGVAGMDPPPVKMVLPCDKLDDSPLGEWEQVALDPAIKQVAALVVDPVRAGTVYFGAGAGKDTTGGPSLGMWKTTDCGANWEKLPTGENSAEIETGLQWNWLIDKNNPDIIYTNSGYGSLGFYRSDDAGNNWKNITPMDPNAPNFLALVEMDITNPKHLVATFHDNCKGEYAPMCLATSSDRGDSWTIVKGPTQGWQEGAGAVVFGPDTFMYAAPVDGLFWTGDGGKTWEKAAPNGNCEGVVALEDGTTYVCADNAMLVSTDQRHFSALKNGPRCTSLVTDGTTLYASYQNDFNGQPFWSAPVDDPTNWTNMPSPKIYQGGYVMGYDPDHHVIYSANNLGGMWRIRLQ